MFASLSSCRPEDSTPAAPPQLPRLKLSSQPSSARPDVQSVFAFFKALTVKYLALRAWLGSNLSHPPLVLPGLPGGRGLDLTRPGPAAAT